MRDCEGQEHEHDGVNLVNSSHDPTVDECWYDRKGKHQKWKSITNAR